MLNHDYLTTYLLLGIFLWKFTKVSIELGKES